MRKANSMNEKGTLMLSTITRPNFFPGQPIDYRDFNRMAQQADKVMALLCQYLYAGGGILVDALEEFRPESLQQLSVLIKPGIAMLPNGQVLILSEERVLDLKEYRPTNGTRLMVISARNILSGKERYTDEEDSAITGFRSEVFEPELLISEDRAPSDAVELFRVILHPSSITTRLPEAEEEWKIPLSDEEDAASAAILDLRFRHPIVPQTYVPATAEQLISLRQSLYRIEIAHKRLSKIFLIADPYQGLTYLSQLHAELLSRPFQPLKLAFLLSEFSKSFSLFLEFLDRHVGNQRTNFDKGLLLNAIRVLSSIRTQEVLPKIPALNRLPEVADLLDQLVNFAESRFSLLDTVAESLGDLRDRLFAFESHISLAGHVFKRVDWVEAKDSTRCKVRSEDNHSRKVAARFKNGEELSLKGLFIREGFFQIDIEVPYPDRPLVLLFHQYIRRTGSELRFEINGKPIKTESSDPARGSGSNYWINYGLVVPPEPLASRSNLLKIRVERADLDFGFFDIAAYQAEDIKGAER